jgi:hypothetical protein
MEIRKLRNASLYILILLGLSDVLSLRLAAQGTSGRILGTVQDQSGAVIVGALVTITDIQRGGARRFYPAFTASA